MNQYGPNTTLETIIRERRNDVNDVTRLQMDKRNGRDRTGLRSAPSAWNNIIQGDAVGDYLCDATYYYELMNVAGTLKWHRATLSVAW